MRAHAHRRSPSRSRIIGSSFRSAVLGTLALAVCFPATARAQQGTPAAAPTYALTAWPTEKSLPGDVFDIAQDAEGYLWLGGPNGLVRFDGSSFQPCTQQSGAGSLPANPVLALT